MQRVDVARYNPIFMSLFVAKKKSEKTGTENARLRAKVNDRVRV